MPIEIRQLTLVCEAQTEDVAVVPPARPVGLPLAVPNPEPLKDANDPPVEGVFPFVDVTTATSYDAADVDDLTISPLDTINARDRARPPVNDCGRHNTVVCEIQLVDVIDEAPTREDGLCDQPVAPPPDPTKLKVKDDRCGTLPSLGALT